jgi:hypothetical protein
VTQGCFKQLLPIVGLQVVEAFGIDRQLAKGVTLFFALNVP